MRSFRNLKLQVKRLGGNTRANTFRIFKFAVGASVAQKTKNAIRHVQQGLEPKNTSPTDFERLKKIGTQGNLLKIQFGCSARILKEWINIDVEYVNDVKSRSYRFPQRETIGSREDLFIIDVVEVSLPLPDNSVHCIFHEDFIEHINQRNTVLFLAETHRVLKPGGVHRINTPELISSMLRHSDFSKGREGVFVGEWDRHTHLNVLTKKYLEELALMVGYRQVLFNSKNESVSPDMPQEHRPGDDRSLSEQIFCDLIK